MYTLVYIASDWSECIFGIEENCFGASLAATVPVAVCGNTASIPRWMQCVFAIIVHGHITAVLSRFPLPFRTNHWFILQLLCKL